jgi:hypothetical protein
MSKSILPKSRKSAAPIKPGSLEDLNRLLGYAGSIQGSALDGALDEQRRKLWEATAVIESVAGALLQHFRGSWPADVPEFNRALSMAARTVYAAAGDLEAGILEDRALAIARAKELAHG